MCRMWHVQLCCVELWRVELCCAELWTCRVAPCWVVCVELYPVETKVCRFTNSIYFIPFTSLSRLLPTVFFFLLAWKIVSAIPLRGSVSSLRFIRFATIFKNPFHLLQLLSFFPTLSHILPYLIPSHFTIFLRFYFPPTSFSPLHLSSTTLLSSVSVYHSSSRST